MWLHFIRTLNYVSAFYYYMWGGRVRYNCVILKEGRTKLFISLKLNFSFLPGPPPPVINDQSLITIFVPCKSYCGILFSCASILFSFGRAHIYVLSELIHWKNIETIIANFFHNFTMFIFCCFRI